MACCKRTESACLKEDPLLLEGIGRDRGRDDLREVVEVGPWGWSDHANLFSRVCPGLLI